MATPKRLRFALVYQAGIANLFEVDSFNASDMGRNARRIYQGDFTSAARLAQGAGYAGAFVRTFWCNAAGDIAKMHWQKTSEGQPFAEQTITVDRN